ncbi:MAG TPA: hypothetical protein VH206_10780 [Xanthobacteraceae bacterium]|jgi:hypothetical protein|nr:hypothetical protein [Xanthobacteraceae bacterium]
MLDDNAHAEIERLEDEIEALAARVENCRKFILAGQIAIAGGGLVLAAMLFGVLRPDLASMAGGMAAIIGGIVAFGSNNSTAKEAKREMAKAEAERAALIEQIELRDVTLAPTLH